MTPLLGLVVVNVPTEGTSEDDMHEGYETPTSEDRRIPPVLRCPPAPRKKVIARTRRSSTVATAFKRKRLFGVAEAVSAAELEEFFKNMEMKRKMTS